jgi:hypothetical protein
VVAAAFSLSCAQLSVPGRRHLPARARTLIALVATRRGSCTLSGLACRCRRDLATLSFGVRRLEEKIAGEGKRADLCCEMMAKFRAR